jgi:hypothetical protein
MDADPKDVGSTFISGLRSAAKAKSDPKGKVTALLAGAVAALGDAKVAADETLKGESLIAEGRILLQRSETNLRRWTITAQIARDAGVSVRAFGEATGAGKMILSRYAGAADLYDAAKANKTPVTIGEALRRSNAGGVANVAEQVAAYVAAEEGTDPVTGTKAVKAQGKPQTVEGFITRVTGLSEVLSDLLSGDYPTPKADTLLALEGAVETLRKMTAQTETLRSQVAKASRTPKAKAAKAA